MPLRVIESPYRDISVPLIKYIRSWRDDHGSEVVTIYTPLFIVGHWWETLLHNHKGRRIRHKLMLVHGVMIALVPWLLDSSDLIYGRRSRPIPGQDRRGEPRRPVQRRPMPPADLKAAREAARAARTGQPMRTPTKSAAEKAATKAAISTRADAPQKVGAAAGKSSATTTTTTTKAPKQG